MYLYLLVNLGAVLIPFIFSFHPKLNFHKEWKWFFPANIIVGALFIAWDSIFTRIGVWGFNPDYVLGVKLWGLPIEEILFFICIPYASIFTLHSLRTIFPSFEIENGFKKLVTYGLIFSLAGLGIFFRDLMYTSITFLVCSASLLITDLFYRRRLDHFYQMYGMIFIPFLIVNGILTGTGIPEEVVWYNNAENLSIRILTIPIEDVFYGLTLLLLNMVVMLTLKRMFGNEVIDISEEEIFEEEIGDGVI